MSMHVYQANSDTSAHANQPDGRNVIVLTVLNLSGSNIDIHFDDPRQLCDIGNYMASAGRRFLAEQQAKLPRPSADPFMPPERGVCPHCFAARTGPSAEAHAPHCPNRNDAILDQPIPAATDPDDDDDEEDAEEANALAQQHRASV